MKCPHCLTSINETIEVFTVTHKIDIIWINNQAVYWKGRYQYCPECKKHIIWLIEVRSTRNKNKTETTEEKTIMVYPAGICRKTLSDAVPPEYFTDFSEAYDVLPLSPRAGAALARRCLQNLLRNHFKIEKSNLESEINHFIQKYELPLYLKNSITIIIEICNLKTNHRKSEHACEICDAEAGEAEWILTILESIFHVYFIQPKLLDKRKSDLNI